MSNMQFKKLNSEQEKAIETEVKMMLHAHRDCLRNQGVDTTKIPFDCRDGFFGETFGIMRTLHVLGYGEYGADNVPHKVYPKWNLKWWFSQLEEEVLYREENYKGSNECDHCFEKYRKDAVRKQGWRSDTSLRLVK